LIPVRSDVDAKAAFVDELRRRGYEARVTATPADITAVKGGDTYYFEVKKTSRSEAYFGAATLTEWAAAMRFEPRFAFVVAFRRDSRWEFHEYTPAEFIEFSSIPPFKVYFQVPLGERKALPATRTTRSVRLTRDRIEAMGWLYSRFQEESRGRG
jgi:Domain of unknown function (DUF3883)